MSVTKRANSPLPERSEQGYLSRIRAVGTSRRLFCWDVGEGNAKTDVAVGYEGNQIVLCRVADSTTSSTSRSRCSACSCRCSPRVRWPSAACSWFPTVFACEEDSFHVTSIGRNQLCRGQNLVSATRIRTEGRHMLTLCTIQDDHTFMNNPKL